MIMKRSPYKISIQQKRHKYLAQGNQFHSHLTLLCLNSEFSGIIAFPILLKLPIIFTAAQAVLYP